MNDLRRKVLGEMEEPSEIDSHLVSRKVLLQDMAGMRLFELRDSLKERPADATIAFRHGLIVHGYRDAFDFILRIWVEEPVEHETQIPGQFEHGLVYILQGIARDVSQTIQVTP